MGVTMSSENFSIDMGYIGFNILRKKVAELAGEEIFEHYKKLDKAMFLTGKDRISFFEEYNKKISDIEKEFKIKSGILDFLYASDCDGKLPFSKCKHIYKVIQNYDDEILYGYSGRNDCAKFSDFKNLIKDCIDNKVALTWY